MGEGQSRPDDADSGGIFPSFMGRGSRPSDTVIIFDWDDTLLCSSAANLQQCDQGQLSQLESACEAILSTAMNIGEVIIVTNGKGEWVQESSRCFLPKIVPLLHRMKVMSARDAYEQSFPMDPFAWKKAAFSSILSGRRSNSHFGGVNLIVLGDSLAEIEAAQTANSLRGTSVVKTVKFKEMPSVDELLGQLRVVTQMLPELVNDNSSRSKILVPRTLPPHLAYLTSWASGWRAEDNRPGVAHDTSSLSPLTLPQSMGGGSFAELQGTNAYGSPFVQEGANAYGSPFAAPAAYASPYVHRKT